ncbi:hypothetical protein BN59_01907 [Legionella massiliensis]|uniref:Class I SAM-dependent methyltransferase n=1 Tax=Legionella massiliensis TaxID=1034943 RepID=A0A078L0S2_9GAMM|nr:hypothetical protein [Legionella massiliensis]CDZ77623.1 hypothetical protein BN59_01907 [Legionella massiliensis]CEE13361.1 hypothetical protein BN1094_01907 [Legionella massiliensis]
MFGKRTDEQISDALLTTYAAWDDYVSAIWASFFVDSGLSQNGVILEIAPGASPKIAYALEKIDFRGDIYLIEPYQDALKAISKKYQTILPQAKLHPLPCVLIDSLNHLPRELDCVISHHPLDDMIMAMDDDPQIFEQLFSWVNQDKLEIHPKFAARWQQLHANPDKISQIENEITRQWVLFVEQIQPKLLMMSQYPSLVLETETMCSLNKQAQLLLQRLKQYFHKQLIADRHVQDLLNHNKNYNFDLIGNEVLNAKNWLIYNRNSSSPGA